MFIPETFTTLISLSRIGLNERVCAYDDHGYYGCFISKNIHYSLYKNVNARAMFSK